MHLPAVALQPSLLENRIYIGFEILRACVSPTEHLGAYLTRS
jgi:hypothetical protein